MRMGRIIEHFASAVLIAALVGLAVGSGDSGSDGGSGTPSKSAVSTGQERRISGDRWFGCSDREYFEKLGEYAIQEDDQAFSQGLSAGLLAGTCTTFKDDEAVYVTDVATLSRLVKVRRKGQTQEYWTNIEALK